MPTPVSAHSFLPYESVVATPLPYTFLAAVDTNDPVTVVGGAGYGDRNYVTMLANFVTPTSGSVTDQLLQCILFIRPENTSQFLPLGKVIKITLENP